MKKRNTKIQIYTKRANEEENHKDPDYTLNKETKKKNTKIQMHTLNEEMKKRNTKIQIYTKKGNEEENKDPDIH